MSRAITVTIDIDEVALGPTLTKAVNTGIDRLTIWASREMRRRSRTVYPGVHRKVSQRTGRVYWTGPGSPRGGYPGLRSGQLTASMTFVPATNRRGSFGASTDYADFVHRDRPFIDLTLQRNEAALMEQFNLGFGSVWAAGADTEAIDIDIGIGD